MLMAAMMAVGHVEMFAQATSSAKKSTQPVVGKVLSVTPDEIRVQSRASDSSIEFVVKPPRLFSNFKLGDVIVVTFRWDGDSQVVVSAQKPGSMESAPGNAPEYGEYGKTAENQPVASPGGPPKNGDDSSDVATAHPPVETDGPGMNQVGGGSNDIGRKLRVAVLDFDDATVRTEAAAMYGKDAAVGTAFSYLLGEQLAKSGSYVLVDRSQIGKLMAEQNMSASNRYDAGTAAKIGKLLNVDAVIVGDVTTFGTDTKHGAGSGSWHGIGSGGGGHTSSKSSVNLTARVIDVHTGEILAAVSGKGESKRSATTETLGSASTPVMGSSDFQATPIGEASKVAVSDLATQLAAHAGTIREAVGPASQPVAGLVADVTNDDLVINLGSAAGLHVGDKLTVLRATKTIKDPSTGKVLRTIERPIGEFMVVNVDAISAEGKFTGSDTPKVGDKVKTPSP